MTCIEVTRANIASLPLAEIRDLADDIAELGGQSAAEMIHGLANEVERLRGHGDLPWYPIETAPIPRSSEEPVPVLLRCGEYRPFIGEWDKRDKAWLADDTGCKYSGITHWMPIPGVTPVLKPLHIPGSATVLNLDTMRHEPRK